MVMSRDQDVRDVLSRPRSMWNSWSGQISGLKSEASIKQASAFPGNYVVSFNKENEENLSDKNSHTLKK